MNKAEQLIACLEGEIAKRDARIVEMESGYTDLEVDLASENYQLRAELSAIKAQEPVARLPACPSRAFAVANLRDLAQSVLQHDPDVGIFRDEDQAFLINELADLAESFNGDVKLYAAPVSEAKAHGVVMPAELGRAFITGESCDGVYRVVIRSETLKEMQAVHGWLSRLNATPIQQVSVPDGWKLAPVEPTHEMLGAALMNQVECLDAVEVIRTDYKAMIAAAPAAPAADALVEALEKLARLGNGDKHGNSDGNLIAQAALAAHSSKGVV